jgi:predicted dehydrogenase
MIRVGIAGLGGMGRMHAQGYAGLRNATIVAGADLEPDRRERFASEHPGVRLYDDFRHMVEADLDAVDICLPSYLHSEAAVAFAQVGRHILCEKPMALTLEECDAMIAAAERSGTTLMVAQVLRFYPEFLAVKEIADSGRYGKVPAVWAPARHGAGEDGSPTPCVRAAPSSTSTSTTSTSSVGSSAGRHRCRRPA